MARRTVERLELKVCSEEFGVATIRAEGGYAYRKKPCKECPWRMDNKTNVFPAEAYRTSAPTAYDNSERGFGCHMSSGARTATCAGYLLRHGDNALEPRIAQLMGEYDPGAVTDGGYPIYPSYREMAVANGVDPDDPSLSQVRGNNDVWDHEKRGWVPDASGGREE